jgi:thymidylate synthase
VDSQIHRLYEKALFNIFSGEQVSPRGMTTLEILNHSVVLMDLRNNVLVSPVRNLNPKFMVAEWLHILFGRSDVGTLAQYNSKIAQFSDDGKVFAGAYGPMLHSQMNHVTDSLTADHFSRQAVVSIWRPSPRRSRDIPCTLSWQFIRREDKLSCVATMRSSDGWLGLPYDLFNVSQITNYWASVLGCDTGFIAMNLGSSHLYEQNWQAAQDLQGSAMETWRSMKIPVLKEEQRYRSSALLQDILVTPSAFSVQDADSLEGPWGSYARVLMAKNREEAWECLREACETS